MSTKQWCDGAGQLAPLKEPTNFVDCPVCARRNLGAADRVDGRYVEGYNPHGIMYGRVPSHTAHALRPEQIPNGRFEPHSDEWRSWHGYRRPM